MERRLICAACGKPITKNDVWVRIEGKPYHIGCAPLRKVGDSGPPPERPLREIVHD